MQGGGMFEKDINSSARSINPAEEDLWAKLMELRDVLDIIEKSGNHDGIQKAILKKCNEKLDCARDAIDPKRGGFPWLSIFKKNHKIFWSLVHRVDEDIILLLPDDEVFSKAVDIKTFISLNAKETGIREEWLGGNGQTGKLTLAMKEFSEGENKDGNRHVIKEALRQINDLMDNNFWILSLNSMVTLLSAIFLGIAMLFFWWCDFPLRLAHWPNSISLVLTPVALLGLMGAYLSNLLTREDFLFVRGPFWRYMFHYVLSKPIVSAFAAIFIFVVEQSKLIFAVVTTVPTVGDAGQSSASQLITVHVSQGTIGYVYAILALASGFSADKILRSMIDRVLKKLENKAEKTKESQD